MRNPETGEQATVDLPAEGWRAAKSGYRFVGPGPCRKVALGRGRLSASCRGADLAFSLDEAQQSALEVELELGARALFCARFGGDVRQNTGTGPSSPRGSFAATNAPAPESCALP